MVIQCILYKLQIVHRIDAINLDRPINITFFLYALLSNLGIHQSDEKKFHLWLTLQRNTPLAYD